MIFDTLCNAKQYFALNPSYEIAFAFIHRAIQESLPVGRYDLDGDKIFAMVQEYNTKAEADTRFEGHQKYIDVQYIIAGTEVMQAVDIAKTAPETDYDAEKDFAFFRTSEAIVRAPLKENDFAIFFPHDIHRPGIAQNNTPEPIKKIVVKIKV